tara:strand:- start:110 stop:502 length:393 start_codon:yes stop_codon:yes gene_type:complete
VLPAALTGYLSSKVQQKLEKPMNLYENIRDDGLLAGVYGFAKDKLDSRLDKIEGIYDDGLEFFGFGEEEEEEEEEQEQMGFANVYSDLLGTPDFQSLGQLSAQQEQLNPFSDLTKKLSFMNPDSEFKIEY